MIILLDNYDSFTYNLYHYLLQTDEEVEVFRNDKVTTDEILNKKPKGIVISPGPCNPDKAGISLDLITKNNGEIPILGVCLGHQAIAQAYGGKVIKGNEPIHGKVYEISHNGSGVFKNLPEKFSATRYHSLIVEESSLPEIFEINSFTEEKTGEETIMGIKHREHPVYGIQFHPESIASEHGHEMIRNFVQICSVN